MLNLSTGILKINDSLILHQGFRFKDFKQTKYYKGQDGISVIYLDEKQQIDDKHYFVSFFFRNDYIYIVSLVNCDTDIPETNEKERKLVHDEILKKNHIENGKAYVWGKVTSEFDAKGNISSIDIYYN